MESPFMQRRAVYGENFFNRENDIDYILGNVLADEPESVSIVSHERMGATSLLKHICEFSGPERDEDALFIYFDMQSVRKRKNFVKTIVKKLGGKGDDYEDFDDALYENRDKPIILCLDHFDRILAWEKEFDLGFFDSLRSYLTNYKNLSYVLVTCEPLIDLEIPDAGKGSLFKNTFQDQWVLKNWQIQEQKIFIRQRFEICNVELSEEDLHFIIRKVGEKSPYHLVVLADHLFHAKIKNDDEIDYASVYKAYKIEVLGVSGYKPKTIGAFLRKNVISLLFFALMLIALLLWGLFVYPRKNAGYQCENTNAEFFNVVINHPKYLANGDSGLINISIKNDTKEQAASVIVIVNFDKPVQTLMEYSNRLEFDRLDSLEQRSLEIRIRRATNERILMIPHVIIDGQRLQCEASDLSQYALLQLGPIPYLMTIWISFGTTGFLSMLGQFGLDWIRNRNR